jgi:hypothetical protein
LFPLPVDRTYVVSMGTPGQRYGTPEQRCYEQVLLISLRLREYLAHSTPHFLA